MQNYFKILTQTPLFVGISEEELQALSGCLGFYTKEYPKDAVIMMEDSRVTDVGIVLSGSLQIRKEDIMGNQSILTKLGKADLFAETFACAEIDKSPVTVVAISPCEVLFIKFHNIITACSNACEFHAKLVENMLRLIARKSLVLQAKIEILSQRSIRDKLMHYFMFLMEEENKATVTSPFNREQLADYLGTDRSAMSRELCKMRDEGLIAFHKNEFTIL